MTPFSGTNRVTSPYGYREYLNSGRLIKEFHHGEDVVCTKYAGEVVNDSDWDFREVTGAVVEEVSYGYNSGRGNLVKTKTSTGAIQIYQHCKEIYVRKGDIVPQGTVLGRAGSTGNSTGIHLHFEVQINGSPVEPSAWLGLPNVSGTYNGNDNLDSDVSTQETIIDVAKYQGDIDWSSVPYRAILRVGYRGYGTGECVVDEKFDKNIAGAIQSGKLFGFYWFSQAVTEQEGREEAEFSDKLISGRGKGLPLFIDCEWSNSNHNGRADGISSTQRTAVARAFCERAKELGYNPGVYTFTSFAQTNIDYTTLANQYIGWLADTRTNFDKTLPRHIHQYGQGTVSGISTSVDMNHVIKSIDSHEVTPVNQLQKLCIVGTSEEIKAKAESLGLPVQTVTAQLIGPASNGDAMTLWGMAQSENSDYFASYTEV